MPGKQNAWIDLTKTMGGVIGLRPHAHGGSPSELSGG